MSRCSDYWCENYGKGNEKCGQCVKKDSPKEKPELQVILKRRADRLMDLTKKQDKDKDKGKKR